MAKTRRVVFSFDERSLESLKRMTEQGRYPSMATAVRDSLQISRALQNQVEKGFTEIVVRNPETNEERVIVIPDLQPPK
jgi:Arc/MetJ-type ribon-helix-helix transcriptional regulator